MEKIVRDGVALAYEEAGSRSPPVVLVHGWPGERSSMRPQLQHLRRRHRVVSVDLRGFGESDRPDDGPYTVESYSDDLRWMCEQLGLERPILVGHSMGGSIVLDAAGRFPELCSAVVILEALVVAPPPLMDTFRPLLDGMRTPAYRDVLRPTMQQLAGPFFDGRDLERMVQQMQSVPQHVLVSSLENLLGFDSAGAAGRCRVPLLYVSSGPWFTDVERFRSLCPQLVTAQLVGCGHYFNAEVPDQLHPILDRFIEIHAR